MSRSKFWFSDLRELFLTYEDIEGGGYRAVFNDPPPDLAEVCDWGRRYNARHTQQNFSFRADDMGRRIGKITGKVRPLMFLVHAFQIGNEGPLSGKNVTLQQSHGASLTAKAYRGIQNVFYEGAVAVEQAKVMLRWALVSDRTLKEFPI